MSYGGLLKGVLKDGRDALAGADLTPARVIRQDRFEVVVIP